MMVIGSHATTRPHVRGPVAVFLLLSLSIIILEGAFYLHRAKTVKYQIYNELSAIADLKRDQIVEWRDERLAYGRMLSNDPFAGAGIAAWVDRSSDAGLQNRIIEWMRGIREYRDFTNVTLVDSSGALLLSLFPEPYLKDTALCPRLAASLASGIPELCDLHRRPGNGIHLDLIVPIVSRTGERTASALVIEINPSLYLYPLIQSWPMPSRSAEALLFRRQGDWIEYLNELRYRKNSALAFRLPATRSGLLAAVALHKDSGVADALDYREKPVLGVYRSIPSSGWHMVAKVDKAEIFSPLRRLFAIMLGFAVALIACAGLLVVAFERRQKAAYYRTLLGSEQRLRQSEERFRLTVEDSEAGYFFIDKDGIFRSVNKAWLAMHGFSDPVEIIGSHFDTVQVPRDVGRARETVNGIMRGEKPFLSGEFSRKCRDGSTGYHTFSARPVTMDGKVIGIEGFIIDSTERRKAREALAALSARNEAILNTVPDIIAEVDEKKTYAWLNKSGIDFFGREAIGREAAHYFEGEQDTYAKVQPLFNGNTDVFYVESWQRRYDGQKRLLAWWCQALKDENGNIKGALSTARDITEQSRYESAIIAEKERFLVTLRSIGDGVITTDTRGTVTFMNRVAEGLTGWGLEESVGEPLAEVFHIIDAQSRTRCENPVDKVLATGGIIGLANHTALIARDGRERIIADSGAPIRDRESAVIGVVLVFRDITDKQKTEDALNNAQRLESIGALAGGIAHDFNNLLGGVFGFMDLALGESKQKKVTDYLSKAMGAMERSRALTRQLLTFAKGGAPVRRPGPLFPFVEETARFALSGSNVSLVCDPPAGLWKCDFDKNQIGQVIDNIVINGQQAMPQGGAIEITASNVTLEGPSAGTLKPGQYVKLSIKDSGIGIPAEILSRIFDPFFTTKQKGSGLGLATSYSIMTRHDGRIDVESEPGRGSAFHLFLPALAGSAQTAASAIAPPSAHKGSGTVLVLDDEDVMRDSITGMLALLGYSAECFADGAGLVEYFTGQTHKGKSFAAIILDLTIPGGMGGEAAGAAIRKIDREVPLFVASGYAEDPILANPRQYGFTDSICKPFIKAELAAMLAKHVTSI